ncbi:MAG: tetratricopeptide repeat protein [Ardenticatenaceae bacterium]|nr:tetratricopeptide repeat protein [Ardenticatenaceae bacterium]
MSERIRTIAAYVPRRLARQLLTAVAPPTRSDSETFAAAVLFADLSGFTSLTELLAQTGSEGLEELTRLLNQSFSQIMGRIEAEGGDVVQFSGDGITAVFAADKEALPIAVRRAYQAGMAVQATMEAIGSLHTSVGAVTLGMKVVIGAGDVTAVIAGGISDRWHYVVMGDPLRQIAVAEDVAERGQIVLSPEAGAMMLAEAVDAVALRPLDWAYNLAAAESALHLFIPSAVHSWLAEGLHDWIGVFRPMTVLFVGIKGVADPQQLHHFLREAQDTIYRYEGSINKLTVDDKGTSLLVLFGAPPYAHEDDPLRSLRCSRELLRLSQHVGLGLSVGITTGRVFAGPIGGTARREYTVMGDRVNVAARLMSLAPTGDIYCDYDTYRFTRTQTPLESLPPVAVKGKAGVIRVYRLADSTQVAEQAAARQPLVGRQTELAQLTAYLDGLRRGNGRILIIEGEAGIGKSRLVEELLYLTGERGLTGLVGAAQSIEQQAAYRAWRDIIADYFGLDDSDDVGVRRQQVRQQVLEVAPDYMERLPLLNDVLNLGLPDTPLASALSGQARHNSLVLFVLELFKKWLRERPLILVLEDAHWCDSLSWDLALQIARTFTLENRAFFLILAMRPLAAQTKEKLAALQAIRGLGLTRSLSLEPLPARDTTALAAARLGITADQLPPTITELIQTRAAGNPFFAQEIIYALRDNGILLLSNGGGELCCELVGDPQDIVRNLPDTLHGIVLSRIDRLTPEQQLTLKVASVIGRSFGYATLRSLLLEHTQIHDQHLQNYLTDLAERDLTVMELPEPDLTYVFKHIITRDVAYETLLFTQRRQLHRGVARWYEQQGSDLSPFYAMLVYHWHQAGDEVREGYYARLAGLRAAAQYANEEALSYFNRALELTPDGELRERFELLLAREQVNFYYAEQEVRAFDLIDLAQLADMLDDDQARAVAAWRGARYAEQIGNYAVAATSAQRAVGWAQAAGDVVSEGEALNQWAYALVRQGYYEQALDLYNRALVINRNGRDERREAQTLANIATLYFYWGKFDALQAFAEQAIALFDKYADRLGQARCLNLLGLAYYESDQFTRAIRQYEQALVTYTDIGDRRGQSTVYSNLGNVYADYGDYEWAEAYYERAIGIDQQIGDRGGEGSNLITLGMVRNDLGEYAAAQANGEAALQIMREIGDRSNEIFALMTLANILSNRGDFGAAGERCREAWVVNEALGARDFELTILIEWGRALLGLGEYEAAAAKYGALLAVCEEMDELAFRIYAWAGLAQIAWEDGRSTEAHDLAQKAVMYMTDHNPEFIQELFRVYLTCYHILAQTADLEMANTVLTQAYTRLKERADKMGDEDLREQLLTEVRVYREIMALYKKGIRD